MESSKEQLNQDTTKNFQQKVSKQIPSFYVDAAEVHPLPFTLQIMLGSQTASGEPEPRLQISMNPLFAAHLRDALSQALDAYQSQPSPVSKEDHSEDRSSL